MAAGSMAEATGSVDKVCPLLTCQYSVLPRTAGPPSNGDQAGGFLLR